MKAVVEAVLTGRVAPLSGGATRSAIAKSPHDEPVSLTPTGLQGDEQADTRHHGGPEKAVHHYARDNYALWRDWAADPSLLGAPGVFGENISTTGLTEENVCVGDVFSLGTAVVQVGQARQPCWKLDERLGRRGTARRMQELRRTGWYYRVLLPGEVARGDVMELQERPEPEWPLDRVLRALFDRSTGPREWEAAASLPTLSEGWRTTFTRRLESGRIEDWTARLGG